MIDPERKPDILIVDDTIANLQVLAGMLRGRGYKARPVPNGRLALQAAEREPPDLILLDVDMPEMNGYEVCERLKANPGLKDIPVIFLSALSETADKLQAFRSGGVDYVTKPFQFEEIEARLETHIALSSLRRELERQNHELQESYDRLRELESLRDSLTSMIVHDLRGPLTGVMGFLDLLLMRGDALDAPLLDYVHQAEESASSMLSMVNQLLDISRLEAQQMPIEMGEWDLGELAREAVASLYGVALDRTVEVQLPDLPLVAACDGEITRRVIANLVGNALKYSRAEVRLILIRDGDLARAEVRDTGLGIPEEFQTRIFEKFGQVEAQRTRSQYSTGLGLTFCKLAVEAQGGAIGVESAVGEGSTFWFALPAVVLAAPAKAHATASYG